jgi:hypothetical protein
LNKKQITTLAVTKAILICWTILGIVITFIIIGGYLAIANILTYSLAAIITGLLLKLKI